MASIIKAIGALPNTFWGIIVLFASMWIAVKYNSNIGYYFAGVGSTLLGINHVLPSPNQVTTVGSNSGIKVESNASDPSGKD
jgi:hypothetical protein